MGRKKRSEVKSEQSLVVNQGSEMMQEAPEEDLESEKIPEAFAVEPESEKIPETPAGDSGSGKMSETPAGEQEAKKDTEILESGTYRITCCNPINEAFGGVRFRNGIAHTTDSFTASWFRNKKGYVVEKE